jgi:hypothetical protein
MRRPQSFKTLRPSAGDTTLAERKAPDARNRAPDHSIADRPSATRRPDEAVATDLIGRHLKLIYDEVASQPVPDRFLALLNQLDDKTHGE